jgi:hypothetical protein
MEHSIATDEPGALTRAELFKLREHYYTVTKDELNFFHAYLNFYTGLLSTLLVATAGGLLQFHTVKGARIILLMGPFLTVALAWLGARTTRVFYNRFIQAWITSVNIDSMLGLRQAPRLDRGVFGPAVVNARTKGFITELPWVGLTLFEKAISNKWTAEDLIQEVQKKGVTMGHARRVFGLACLAAFLLSAAVVFFAQ